MRATCLVALLSWAATVVPGFNAWGALVLPTSSVSSSPSRHGRHHYNAAHITLAALSNNYLENDLVAVQRQPQQSSSSAKDNDSSLPPPRLCVVRPDATVAPLCQHEDDVETDLFLDPRCDDDPFWFSEEAITDDVIRGTYGEGWYGQRPVPSLGGGPGYGASAQEIWSIDQAVLDQLAEDGVELPILDVGIAHGEKARGGCF